MTKRDRQAAEYMAEIGYTTHPAGKCKGRPCCIHNPSDHHMRDWPLNYRPDKGQMERICPHGVGHPDPDDAAYWESIGKGHMNIHGCDGCCSRCREFDLDE